MYFGQLITEITLKIFLIEAFSKYLFRGENLYGAKSAGFYLGVEKICSL